MRWQGRRQSENVEDRRASGGGGGGPVLAMGGGVGTIILVIIVLLMGGDPRALLNLVNQRGGGGGGGVQLPGGGGAPADPNAPVEESPEEAQLREFVSVVLAETEEVWTQVFAEQGERYTEPKLVLFRGQVSSACGFAQAAMGPFYCGEDQKVYIDLSFYDELRSKFKAPGDFAQAYVIAHEIGHHVQKQMGILDQVHARRRQMSDEEYNRLSVRLELQADFLAGLWAHHAQKTNKILDPDDLEEALRAATAIGDDRLQKQSQGFVVPDSFTHGTSAQRVRWFKRGFETGDMSKADTFKIPYEEL
jgi:uncharacterized protein